MSFTKVFDPRTYRAAFADRWASFLHENYQNPEEVAHCFGVRFQTAVNWWNGTNRPSGDVVALAALRHGATFTEHKRDRIKRRKAKRVVAPLASIKRDSRAREPSGRLSRKKEDVATRAFEEGPQQTVLQARRRTNEPFSQPVDTWSLDEREVLKSDEACKKWRERMTAPVSKGEASRKGLLERGTVLWSLCADGEITREQAAAGDNFAARYVRYASLNGLPKITPSGSSYGDVRGGSRPERLEAARLAKADHMIDRRIIMSCSAGAWWAMVRTCVENEPAPIYLLKLALSALVENER